MERLLKKILTGITPTKEEKIMEKKTAEKIINKIRKMKGKHIEVQLCGSLARDTHLRGYRDIDIFVLFPEKMPRAEFEKEGLRIGRQTFNGKNCWEEYSEHPYIKGIFNGFEIEIVPSYKVKKASLLKSSVDRSPFHQKFLSKKLDNEKRKEIRLLKAFLKGIDCYGAKIEKEGISGYLAELLILKYGSFKEFLKAASNWKPGITLSLSTKPIKLKKEFNAPLVFIDPTDNKRNVAAALSEEQFARVIAASQAFLEKPSKKFFYPKRKTSISKKRMKKLIAVDQVFALRMPFPKKVPSDIIWGQMRKFNKLLRKRLESEDFIVRRISLYAEEGKEINYFIELESIELNDTIIFKGPPAWNTEHSMAFLKKHRSPLTGPRIENAHWVVEEKRKHKNAVALTKKFLKERKKVEKKPFKNALSKAELLEKKEFLRKARTSGFFKYNLSRFLEGKESFL